MRRFLLAAAALLTVAVSTSSAGYLIIRVLLESPGGSAAAPPPGGPVPGGGATSGRPGGGVAAGQGSFGSGGSAGGGQGLPGWGAGQPGGAAAGPVGPADPSRSVVVVIPYTKKPVEKAFYPKTAGHPLTNPKWDFVMGTPNGGSTNLFTDGSTIQWYFGDGDRLAQLKPRSVQIAERYAAWQKSRAEEPLLDLVSDALEQGFVAEAVKYADELLALTKVGKKSPPDRVLKFAQAYGTVQAKLTAPATKPNDAERWRTVIDSVDARTHHNRHYSLISWDASTDELTRRFAQLDDNFKAFYLWHAVQGVALDVPEKPLTAVLPRRAEDLFKLSQVLDGLPIEADAFYSAEHDLLVLSPERTDSAGQTFLRQNQTLIYKDGLSRAKLLAGDGPKIDGQHTPDHVARMMTLALVEKYAEVESELSGVSREGCRQLMYASGALPRHVVLPRWVSNGSANFFTRPKGPVYSVKRAGGYTTDEPAALDPTGAAPAPPAYSMTVALTTGYGGPNFVLQRYFKDMAAAKELNADRGQLLRNVVTDAYFNALAKDGEDVDPLPKQAVAIPIPSGGLVPSPGGGFAGSAAGGGPRPGGPRGGSGGGLQPPGSGGGLQLPGSGGSGAMQLPGSGGSSAMQPPGGLGVGVAASPADDLIAIRRKKAEKLSVKSQATSWALYYYLVKRHPASLTRFIDEMARLPRDLPIDEQTTLVAFARSFNLTTAAAGESGKATFAEFAAGWMTYMTELPPAGIDIDKLLDVAGKPGGAGRTIFPGGGSGGTGSPDGGG